MVRTTELSTARPTYTSGELLRDLGRWIQPYRRKFIAGSFFRLSSDLVNLYPPYGLAAIITFFAAWSPGESTEKVWMIFALTAAALTWRPIAQMFAKGMVHRVGERAAIDVQNEAFRRLAHLDMSWHERENVGNKIKRVHNGSDSILLLIRIWINRIIEIVVYLIGMTAILAHEDVFIAGASTIFIVTFAAIAYLFGRKVRDAAHAVNIQDEHVSGLAFELVNNIRTVKVLGMFRALRVVLDDAFTELNIRLRKRIFWFQMRGGVLGLWGNLFRAGMLALILVGIMNGRYEVGFLILFNGYFVRLWEAASELADSALEFTVAKHRIARLKEILSEPVVIDSEIGKVPFPKEWKELRVEQLSFAYGHIDAIQDISFTIRRGEKIGIVGLSGAGKSTLMKLLLKENEDYEGSIAFDHIPLRTISRSSYFAHAAAVLQDTELFNLSLRENIELVDVDGSGKRERLEEAIATAHVDDFLAKLPDGTETIIGEKGIKLSGGEKQRVGIARAVFKRPDLLFLDEATSHLDLESEEKIQDSLHALFQHVTAVVIAHRLTTIKEMDRILVLEQGRLIEEGSFEELMYERPGRFAELWEKQKL